MLVSTARSAAVAMTRMTGAAGCRHLTAGASVAQTLPDHHLRFVSVRSGGHSRERLLRHGPTVRNSLRGRATCHSAELDDRVQSQRRVVHVRSDSGVTNTHVEGRGIICCGTIYRKLD